MIIRPIVAILLLACALSLAWVVKYQHAVLEESPVAPPPAPPVVSIVVVTNGAPPAPVAVLSIAVAPSSNEVEILQAALRERDAIIASLRQSRTNRVEEPERSWRNPTNWLEQIRSEDPKRYEEIIKARDEARQRVDRSFAEKADYLLKRDKTQMEAVEKAEYEQMVSLMTDTWKLSETLRAENLPREQRWETMGQIRENMRTLEPMMDNERERALYEVGLQLGYGDAQAEEFVQYMNDLIDVTSMQRIYRDMRQGGGGPGGWRERPRESAPPR